MELHPHEHEIFGVVHGAKGYTAWSDKHPAYSAVWGPRATAPTSTTTTRRRSTQFPVSLPGIAGCDPLPRNKTKVASSNSYTDSFQNIQCYDSLKVQAIVNEINSNTP